MPHVQEDTQCVRQYWRIMPSLMYHSDLSESKLKYCALFFCIAYALRHVIINSWNIEGTARASVEKGFA